MITCGAKVLGSITVGDGAVIGANAVVIRDVEPGAVMGGIPAKRLGSITGVVDMKPVVSVIIPVWQGEKTLRRCVESLV